MEVGASKDGIEGGGPSQIRRKFRIVKLIDSAPLLLIPILIIGLRPFYGHFDDGLWLRLADTGNPLDLLSGTTENGISQLDNGTMRYVSQLVIWPQYFFSAKANLTLGPLILHLFNALLVIGGFAIFLLGFQRVFFPDRRIWLGRLTALSFLWPFSADLLFFPSLQEKIVLLGAGVLLLLIDHSLRREISAWIQLVIVAVAITCFLTKSHVLLFVPTFFAAVIVLARDQRASNVRADQDPGCRLSRWRPSINGVALLWVCLIGLGATVVATVMVRGSYSSSTRGSPNASSVVRDWRFILVVIVALMLYLVQSCISRRERFEKGEGQLVRIRKFALLITIGPFIGVFFIWEMRNYYLTLLAPLFALLVSSCVEYVGTHLRRVPNVFGQLLYFSPIVLTLLWMAYRVPLGFGATSSFGVFLDSGARGPDDTVYVMCGGAAEPFNFYSSAHSPAGPNFVWVGRNGEFLPQVAGSRIEILVDEMFCPIDRFEVPVENPMSSVVWETGRPNSYRLYSSLTSGSG